MHAIATGAKGVALAAMLLALSVSAATPPSGSRPGGPAAEVPRKDAGIGGALRLGQNVAYQFQTVTGPVRMDIVVTNESATTTSGSVRVAILVTEDPDPSVGTYWTVAYADFGSLGPGAQLGPLAQTVPYLAPPDGIYYAHMGALEYEPATCGTPSGFCLDSYVTFGNRIQVFNGEAFDAGPPPTPRTQAVEYYHEPFGHYFVTSFANEIQLLDAGVFAGWRRTGFVFDVWTAPDGGMPGVCRFFSTSFAPKSSHFYTPFPDECQTVLTNPDWQFEAVAFYVEYPDTNGSCMPGQRPLYRLFNNGAGGAPNHRYTTSLEMRHRMMVGGWTSEGWGPLGTIACVPS